MEQLRYMYYTIDLPSQRAFLPELEQARPTNSDNAFHMPSAT